MSRKDQPILAIGDTHHHEDYFQKIESLFAALRQRGTILSSNDYQLSLKWYEQGIPLSCVLRGIRAAFYKKELEEGEEEQEVKALSWCKWAVQQEWKEYKSQAIREEEPYTEPEQDGDEIETLFASMLFDLGLAAKAHLEAGRAEVVAILTSISGAVLQLESEWKTNEQPVAETETKLMEIDERMIGEIRTVLDDAAMKKINSAINRQMKKAPGNMSEEALESTRQAALNRKIRKELRLPRLTLYTL